MRNSRVKKNKNRRKSMALAISLGLVLATGSAVGTWSYFTAKAETKSTVNVTVGNVRTLIVKNNSTSGTAAINITGLLPNQSSEAQKFQIKNAGSLTQKISLHFDKDPVSTMPTDALRHFEYNLQFANDKGENIKTCTGTLNDLVTANGGAPIKIEKQNPDGTASPFYLKPNEELTGTLTVQLDNEVSYEADNKKLDFTLKAVATQVNDENWDVK